MLLAVITYTLLPPASQCTHMLGTVLHSEDAEINTVVTPVEKEL